MLMKGIIMRNKISAKSESWTLDDKIFRKELSKGSKVHKRWTDAEIKFIENNYNTKTIDEIAKHLNRSMSSVYCKIKRDGIIEHQNNKLNKINHKNSKKNPFLKIRTITRMATSIATLLILSCCLFYLVFLFI